MTIQDLGSLGELVAAIATVATLVYLALQIRHNTSVGRATGTSAQVTVLNDFNFMLMQNPELYRLYFDGLADPKSIEESDIYKFDMLIGTFLQSLQQTYNLHREGALGSGVWENLLPSLGWLIGRPGFSHHWNRWVRSSESEFNQLISELMIKQRKGASD